MTADMASAQVSEIFTSIEGEGLWTGTPAVFVRLSGCNLACAYCDTKYARESTEQAVVYPELAGEAGGEAVGALSRTADRAGLSIPNPISAAHLVSLVKGRSPATLVFTGGEPLLQADFLRGVGGELRRMGYRLHLETNGTLPDALGHVMDVVDFISMDIKLPSSQRGRDLFGEHRSFLEALKGKPAAVKIVITADTTCQEVADAARLVAAANRWLPVFLQPAFEGSRPTVDADRLLDAQALARRSLGDVRISLQVHKVLGVR